MAIINFTVEFAMYANQADTTLDSDVDADRIPLVGTVTFEPVMRDDRAIMAPTYSPPAGLKIRTITGFIDSDGILYAYRGGPEGVRLWANDPVLGLPALTYRVSFDLATPLGESVRVDSGVLAAPQDDRVINLAEALQSGNSIGGPRLVAGEFADGAVVFEDENGTYLQAIDIPAGTLVFTDNGDSTWSVG